MMRQAGALTRHLWTGVSGLSRRLLHSSHRAVRVMCWWLCQPLRWLVGLCLIAGLVCIVMALSVWFVLLDMMHDITGRLDNR